MTDEQRSRRLIFIATLWAGASWLFFRVARSTRMIQIWVLRSRLEKQPTDLLQTTSYFGDRTLGKHLVKNGDKFRDTERFRQKCFESKLLGFLKEVAVCITAA